MKAITSLICLLCLSSLLCSAQTAKKKNRAKANPYSQVSFDESVKQLPVFFVGHPVADVWLNLNQRRDKLMKGEYDTTEAYISRLAVEMGKPVYGSVNLRSNFAFMTNDLEIAYQADEGTLEVSVRTDSFYDQVNEYKSQPNSVSCHFISENKGSYIGSNAFGVKRRVRIVSETDLRVVLVDEEMNLHHPLVEIQADPVLAKKLKPQIRVLMVGQIVAPWIGMAKNESEATISDPISVITREMAIYLKPSSLIVYNIYNGEIYHRVELKEKPIRYDENGQLPSPGIIVTHAPAAL